MSGIPPDGVAASSGSDLRLTVRSLDLTMALQTVEPYLVCRTVHSLTGWILWHDRVDTLPKFTRGRCGWPVSIGDGAWFGANTTVRSEVSIGERAIVGAGSVIVRDVPAWSVAVGNRCTIIKRWDPEVGRFLPAGAVK